MLVAGFVLLQQLAELRDDRLFVDGKPTWFKLDGTNREEIVNVKRAGKLIVGTIEQDFSGAYSGTHKWTFIKDSGKVYLSDSGPLFSAKNGQVIVGPNNPYPSIINYGTALHYRAGKFSKISEATQLWSFDGKVVKGWYSCTQSGEPFCWNDFGVEEVPYGQAFRWANGKRTLLQRIKLVRSSTGYVWP